MAICVSVKLASSWLTCAIFATVSSAREKPSPLLIRFQFFLRQPQVLGGPFKLDLNKEPGRPSIISLVEVFQLIKTSARVLTVRCASSGSGIP